VWLLRVRAHASLTLVLAIHLLWTAIAAVSSERRPWGDRLWNGEGTPVEIFELLLIAAYIPAWTWIALRGPRRFPRRLALAMVLQLCFVLGEELDWGGALVGFRNFRQLLTLVLPDILDIPLAAGYLLLFLLLPLVPLASVASLLERAAPVRAERADALAVIAVAVCWPFVWLLVGDQVLGELQQLCVYAVLGVVTLRVVRRLPR
jgi:hypothetical protein